MSIKKTIVAVGIFAVLGGGGYAAYDYFAGNHITIQEVIPASSSSSAPAAQQVGAAAVVGESQMNGQWSIQADSKVYFSVTTSKETVNFEGGTVKGQWNVDTTDASKMSAEGVVTTAALQSGNNQRDGHIKGAEYLNVTAFPEATFKLKAFDNFPKEWKEGAKASFNMTGTLTVKGVSKDVSFKTDALYSEGSIKLEGSTMVTFADFGMKNPHTVVLDTQNDLTVQLRLILKK
ncbi:hypothetical protein D3C73_688290 [compost metagenome]